ncbi:MAG: hypothetical protein RXN87_05045 [Acidilobus sp.]
MERDDLSALLAAILGGVGAIALFMGAVAEALGCAPCRYVMYAGVAMLLISAALLGLLFIPPRRAGVT